MSKGRRKSRRVRGQKRQERCRERLGLEGPAGATIAESPPVAGGAAPGANRLGSLAGGARDPFGIREIRSAETAPSEPRELVAREFFAGRLNHLSRRLEEIHQAEVSRFSEERRETWILVFALSVVLVFCFAAFFMNQMEVRDLRNGLEDEFERRSQETITSIEKSLDGFQLDRVPRMQASLEKLLRQKEERDREEIAGLRSAIELDRRRTEDRYGERLRALEDDLEAILRMTRSSQAQGETAGPEPRADADAHPEHSDGSSDETAPSVLAGVERSDP